MAITETDAGNMTFYEGTATEIAAVVKGESKSNILGFAHNGTSGEYCLILGH